MRRLGLGRTKRNQNYAKTKRRDRIIYLTVYEDRETECFMRINAKAVVALAAALVVLAAWAMGCLALEEQGQDIEAAAQAAQEESAPQQALSVEDGRGDAQTEQSTDHSDDGPAGQDAQEDGTPAADEAPVEEGQQDQETQEGEETPDRAQGEQSPQGEKPAEESRDEAGRRALDRIKVSINQDVLQPGSRARTQVAYFPKGWRKDAPVSWSSSEPHLVTVNKSGLVRVNPDAQVPREGAYVDIWACTTDGSLVMDCVTVRVMPATQSLRLAQEQVALSLTGETFAGVAVEMQPESLVGLAKVRWESSDESVVKVSASGAGEAAMLYAVGPGNATVTARAQDGSGCSASLTVTVQ